MYTYIYVYIYVYIYIYIGATVPIVTLGLLDDQGEQTGYTCDLCYKNLLPTYNTRLIIITIYY